MKREYARWDSVMTEILEYSVKEYLSASERAFFRGVYDFGQRLGFTTPKQDFAVLSAIKRAKRGATDRAAIKRKRATQEIWRRERQAEEGKQEENNDAGAFNREVAGALVNTGEA